MLDPQAQHFLTQLEALGEPRIESLSPTEARRSIERVRHAFAAGPVESTAVADRSITGPHGAIPIRVYTPGGDGPFPALVYFHGGGWVLGDIEMVDGLARALANGAGCIVVSVQYRLAPEHRFPIPFDDAYAATTWVVANAEQLAIDAHRVAVSGDSAGGNLAAAVCLAARDRSGPRLACQLLIYPAVDCNFDRPSFAAYGEGYFLTTVAMQWFWGHYLATPNDATHPYAAPLRAAHLRDLPPAVIVIAGYDPLGDEGLLYAQRLENDGNRVQVLRYDGMLHGFMVIGAFAVTRKAVAECCTALRAAFSRRGLPDTQDTRLDHTGSASSS